MLTDKEIARMVMMRGLGYDQTEIAKEFSITQGAVSYNLKQLRKRAHEEGLEASFVSIMAAGGSMDVLRAGRFI